jgi:glyoxylase-like metal-dependent hydrolase (beta-lactamase superfamily II)
MKIHIMDLNFFTPKVIASFFIETDSEPILIETGPDSTFPNLIRSLKGLGYSVEDIKKVFVTHIHLDHAGAAWHFAQSGATIYVHPVGAKHLADPTKLLASARMIYKDQMKKLWGTIEPISKERIYAIADGEILKIGSVEIQAVETLGHASHHHAYVVDDAVFTGDIGGSRIENGPVLPLTPPPDINVEFWQQSIKKLRELNSQVLYPTHFGESTGINEHLDELEKRLLEWTEWIGDRLKEGKDEDDIVPEFENLAKRVLEETKVLPDTIKAYEFADPFWLNVLGLARYWRKYRLSQL